MNPLLIGALAAAGIGGAVYLARRSSASSANSDLLGSVLKRNLRLVKVRPGVGVDLPDVPGLRERERLEPGFSQALMDVIRETGANGDRLAAYISLRSKFDPAAKDKSATGLSNWKGGVGLLGFQGSKRATALSKDYLDAGGDLAAYMEYEPNASEYVRSMTGIQQVKGPLRDVLLKHPAFAQDPALHILGPFFGNTEDLPGDPPKWDETAMMTAPDSTILIEQPYKSIDPMAHATAWDEQTWPELGNFDRNKDGVVTLGDIRNRYYATLSGAGRFA